MIEHHNRGERRPLIQSLKRLEYDLPYTPVSEDMPPFLNTKSNEVNRLLFPRQPIRNSRGTHLQLEL